MNNNPIAHFYTTTIQLLFKKTMLSFDQEKRYPFQGDYHSIENKPDDFSSQIKDGNYELGHFIQFVGNVWGSDWLQEAKAEFENGKIHPEHYHFVLQASPDSLKP